MSFSILADRNDPQCLLWHRNTRSSFYTYHHAANFNEVRLTLIIVSVEPKTKPVCQRRHSFNSMHLFLFCSHQPNDHFQTRPASHRCPALLDHSVCNNRCQTHVLWDWLTYFRTRKITDTQWVLSVECFRQLNWPLCIKCGSSDAAQGWHTVFHCGINKTESNV